MAGVNVNVSATGCDNARIIVTLWLNNDSDGAQTSRIKDKQARTWSCRVTHRGQSSLDRTKVSCTRPGKHVAGTAELTLASSRPNLSRTRIRSGFLADEAAARRLHASPAWRSRWRDSRARTWRESRPITG